MPAAGLERRRAVSDSTPTENEPQEAPEVQSEAAGAPVEAVSELAESRARFMSSWRSAWPILLMAAGIGLMAAGGAYALLSKPQRPYERYLSRAEALIAQEDYSEALDELNTEIFAYADDHALMRTQEGRARMLAARAIYLGQQGLGIGLEENYSNVVGEYLAAEDAGVALGADDVYFLADSFVELGRDDRAVRRAESLPPDRRQARAKIYRKLVDRELAEPTPDFTKAIEWTKQVAEDTGLAVEDQIWATVTRSRIRLAQGYVEEAIERLVQSLVRFEGQGLGRAQLSELYLQLGEAYLQLGDQNEARTQFERAMESLGIGEVHRGRAELELAKLERDPERRLGMFEAVAGSYSTTQWMLPALLGVAETKAQQGDLNGANESYDTAIAKLLADGPSGGVNREVLTRSLLEVHRRLMDSGDTAGALRFGSKIEPLYEFTELPDEVLTELAKANRKLADELLPDGGEIGLSWTDLQAIDPATRSEAQGRLLRAARYYAEYARRVVITDNTEYAAALWDAARAYDLGGDLRRAIIAYQEYASGFPDDPRRFEAAYRLAQAYQVTGQFALAAELYEELIAGPQTDDGERGAVLFGEASYVPLAQTLLADADETNDDRAQELLERVVSGAVVMPGATAFRDALFELARLHFSKGEHARAVERLDEALARFPDDARAPVGRYRLAEAHRMLAGDLQKAIEAGGRPDSELQAMKVQWDETLRTALGEFDKAIEALDAIDPRRRDDLEELSLRNAFFYRGDCAFDLKDYDAAIRYYDEARDRYANDPASLVAMIQIVNAHVAMGDLDRARTANSRARRFFESLPPEVWDDPYLPMDRSEWERWLDSTDVLYRRRAEVGG